MAAPLICSPHLSDLGTLVVSSEVPGMEGSNLLSKQPFNKWRTQDLSGIYLTMDKGSAQAVGLVFLGFTNATSAGQARVRGADSEANLTAAPTYDSGLVDIWLKTDLDDRGLPYHFLHILPTTQTLRWWRIDITDAANADGYFEAGRLYIVNPWQPSRGIQFAYQPPGPVPRSEQQESIGGNTFVTVREAGEYSEFSFRFSDLTAEKTEVSDNVRVLDRIRGDSKDILVVLEPDQTDFLMDNIIYGVAQNLRGAYSPSYRIIEKRYQIKALQ